VYVYQQPQDPRCHQSLRGATRDHNINPDLERYMAKRAGSETIEVPGSHAVYVSKPMKWHV
jgi:hypothetical protein